MSNFEEIAKKEFLNSKKEILPFIFEGEQYWLKRARQTRPDKLQNFFYKFLPFELLIPPLVKNKNEALNYEVSKLKEFATLGVNVPTVVYSCEDFFVLEDSGICVYTILKNIEISEEEFYFYVDLLLLELSKIHNFELFHGGSQLRNFTFKNNKVFVIDFEESFEPNVDIKTLQYRDFLLFILSFTKIKKLKFNINYEKIINRYIELTNNNTFKDKLILLSKKLKPFLWLYERDFINSKIGSDVKNFFHLVKILNKMDKNAK